MLGHVGQHSHTPLFFSRLLPRSRARPVLLYSFLRRTSVWRCSWGGGWLAGKVWRNHVCARFCWGSSWWSTYCDCHGPLFWLRGCFIQSMVKMQSTSLQNRLFSFLSRFAFFSSVNEICIYRRKQPGFKPRPATPCCIFHGLAPAEKKFGTGAGRS